MKNKHTVFDYPSNNILMWRVTYEEDFLNDNYELALQEKIIFRPSTKRVRLDEFKTDILYWGGMDPWDVCQNNGY